MGGGGGWGLQPWTIYIHIYYYPDLPNSKELFFVSAKDFAKVIIGSWNLAPAKDGDYFCGFYERELIFREECLFRDEGIFDTYISIYSNLS